MHKIRIVQNLILGKFNISNFLQNRFLKTGFHLKGILEQKCIK